MIMLVSSVLIAYKLSESRMKKSKLTQGSKSFSSKEINAALTVVSLAILQCCSYFPTTFFCMVFCLASGDPKFQKDHPESYADIAIAFDLVNVTFSLAHVWNFYVYFARIASFRKVFLKYFCCCRDTSLASTKTESLSTKN